MIGSSRGNGPLIEQAAGGGGGTPLALYPDLTLEEIEGTGGREGWTGFVEPEPPTLTESQMATTWSTLVADATANPNTPLLISTNQPASPDPLSLIEIVNADHVEIRLADGVVATGVEFGSGCDHVRLRGMGNSCVLNHTRIAGSATHVVIDSFMMPGSPDYGAAIEVQGGTCSSLAIMNCVVSSVDYPLAIAALFATATDILIANCNFANDAGGGAAANWTVRFSGVSRVVVVDTYCKSVTSQPPFRRNDGDKFSYFRCTTIHPTDGESFSDVSGGTSAVIDDCYLYDCTSYCGGTANRFGGTNLASDNYSVIWRVYNHTWHAVVGLEGGDLEGSLEDDEALERNAGDWEYLLETPSFNTWDGSAFTWQTVNNWNGVALDVSDPEAL